MEYELLKEIDAQYLIGFLHDLNNTATKWGQKLNSLHQEYDEIKEFDSDNEYALNDKIEEFNDSSKSYYNEILAKVNRTRLEIASIYSYIIGDKMFLSMVSDVELMHYFRECSELSEELTTTVNKLRKLSLINKNLNEYKRGYDYNLLDIGDDFYNSYDDQFDNLYLEDANSCCKSINKDLQKAARSTLTLKKMVKENKITYR